MKTFTWQVYIPKTITVLRDGYGLKELQRDLLTGLTVAIVALPLAMALGIASGATPATVSSPQSSRRGPFCFGVANRLGEVLDQIGRPPKVFILQLEHVPLFDATSVSALTEFFDRCHRHGTIVILAHLNPEVKEMLHSMAAMREVKLAANYHEALEPATALVTPQNVPQQSAASQPASAAWHCRTH